MNKKLKALTTLEAMRTIYDLRNINQIHHIDMFDHNKNLLARVFRRPSYRGTVRNHMVCCAAIWDKTCPPYTRSIVFDTLYSPCPANVLRVSSHTRHLIVTTIEGCAYAMDINAWRGGQAKLRKIYDPREERDQDEIMHVTYIGRKSESNE